MKKLGIMVFIFCIFAFAPVARAEYPTFAFSNPTFMNGNSFNGNYYLEKAKATNEYQQDVAKEIRRMTDRIVQELRDMTGAITDSIDDLTLNMSMTFNNLIQSGNNNEASMINGGFLTGFDPTWSQ